MLVLALPANMLVAAIVVLGLALPIVVLTLALHASVLVAAIVRQVLALPAIVAPPKPNGTLALPTDVLAQFSQAQQRNTGKQ